MRILPFEREGLRKDAVSNRPQTDNVDRREWRGYDVGIFVGSTNEKRVLVSNLHIGVLKEGNLLAKSLQEQVLGSRIEFSSFFNRDKIKLPL